MALTDDQRARLRAALTEHAAPLGGGQLAEQTVDALADLIESAITPLSDELTRSAQLIGEILAELNRVKNRAELAELKIEGVRQAATVGKQRDPHFALVKILALTGGQG